MEAVVIALKSTVSMPIPPSMVSTPCDVKMVSSPLPPLRILALASP